MKKTILSLLAFGLIPAAAFGADYEIYHSDANILDPNSISIENPRLINKETEQVFFVARENSGYNPDELERLNAFL